MSLVIYDSQHQWIAIGRWYLVACGHFCSRDNVPSFIAQCCACCGEKKYRCVLCQTIGS